MSHVLKCHKCESKCLTVIVMNGKLARFKCDTCDYIFVDDFVCKL